MCRRKRRYSLRWAERVANAINRQQPDKVHPYECPLCGHWHVGHKRKR